MWLARLFFGDWIARFPGQFKFTLNESQMKNLRDFEGRNLFFGTIMTDGLDVVKENFGKRLIEQEEGLKQSLAISQDPAGRKGKGSNGHLKSQN